MTLVTSTGTVSLNSCTHRNGWYHTCEFKILGITFTKRLFICSDCGADIEAKLKERVK